MAGTRKQFCTNDGGLVRVLQWEIVVVVCASPFRSSVVSGLGDVYPGRRHRCNAVHLHLVLGPGLDLFSIV